jgi:hypothetical protein
MSTNRLFIEEKAYTLVICYLLFTIAFLITDPEKGENHLMIRGGICITNCFACK